MVEGSTDKATVGTTAEGTKTRSPLDELRRRDGVLLRWTDGTLYFIPRERLEAFRIDAAAEGIPGTQEGNDVQAALDRMPPVYRIKNAIRTLGDTFDDLVDAGGPGGEFKPKTANLAEVAQRFPASRGYRAWMGFADPETRD
jgi:hypothetical protein